jgi:ATP-binding cassette subfamily C (CFTR/MRP) protein 4
MFNVRIIIVILKFFFRFDQSILFFHYLWAGPLQLLIITGLLWGQLGPSSLTGTVLLILFVPVQSKNIQDV